MRVVTPHLLRREKAILSELEDDWKRLNKPTVDYGLRSSMLTKIDEQRALVRSLDERLLKQQRKDATQREKAVATG